MEASRKEVSDKEAFGKVTPQSACEILALPEASLPMAPLPEAFLRVRRAGFGK